ncbi:MAG: HAMP domain-containing sensor histidine kinase [Candidatus Microsaccharimonas sp.]
MFNVKQRKTHLAATYLAIIMALSLVFSGLIFAITTSQLDRPLPPARLDSGFMREEVPSQVQAQIDERTNQTKQSLVYSLLALNILMLGAGGVFSYILAGKTLKPIEEALEAQSRFVTDASHELRTPLTALQLTNDVALRKKHIDDTAARELLKKNNVEVEKLRLLAESLLTLSQTENEKVNDEKINLTDSISQIINELQPVALAKSISVVPKLSNVVIQGNSAAISQIITIFLDNAIKYTNDGGVVHISLRKTKDSATVSVKDTGIGIAEDDQKRVFERFYRADASRSRSQSTSHGLGLSIAQSLADRLGYTLQLESQPGVGSTFKLHIPVAE